VEEGNEYLKICDFVHCTKGSEAIELIKAERNQFVGILVANNIASPDAISVIKASLTFQIKSYDLS